MNKLGCVYVGEECLPKVESCDEHSEGKDICESEGGAVEGECIYFENHCYKKECESFSNSISACLDMVSKLIKKCFVNGGGLCASSSETCDFYDGDEKNCVLNNSAQEGYCAYKDDKCYEISKVPKNKSEESRFPLWMVYVIGGAVGLIIIIVVVIIVVKLLGKKKNNTSKEKAIMVGCILNIKKIIFLIFFFFSTYLNFFLFVLFYLDGRFRRSFIFITRIVQKIFEYVHILYISKQ
jgi:hypothetical protein